MQWQMHNTRKVQMDEHSFLTGRNITLPTATAPYPGLRAAEMSHGEHYPSHTSRTVTMERFQVNAPTEQAWSQRGWEQQVLRRVGVSHTEAQAGGALQLSPSMSSHGEPAPQRGWNWNNSSSREPSGSGGFWKVMETINQAKSFRLKFRSLNTLKKEKQTTFLKKTVN